MTAANMIAVSLSQVTALTAIVGSRIYHGMRPASTKVPCINFFEVAGGQRINGYERETYSINCRATTAATAIMMAKLVTDLFHGTAGTGTYGYQTGFEMSRMSLRQKQGLVPEVSDNLYNAPVDIFIVYPTSSVT